MVGQAHGTSLLPAGPRRRRPAGGGRAGGQVDQRRGHLRHRPGRQAAARGPASTGRPARSPSGCAKARHVRPHGDASRSGCTTSPPTPARRTLPAPTDDTRVVARLARALLGEVDTSGGVRLLGVGRLRAGRLDPGGPVRASTTTRAADAPSRAAEEAVAAITRARQLGTRHGRRARRARAGLGLGVRGGRVTVRFETAETAPGPVRTFRVDDPELVTRACAPAD